METLGEKIVALRKANGLLQSELANEIHVSCSTLCRWEKNQRKPSDADITALANFFGISEKELMPDDKTLSDRRFSVLKPGVMIAIAVVIVLSALVATVWIHRNKKFTLVEENRALNAYELLEVDRKYILPKNHNDNIIDRFIYDQEKEVFSNPQYDDCEAIGLFFFETREQYEQDDIFLISVSFRQESIE